MDKSNGSGSSGYILDDKISEGISTAISGQLTSAILDETSIEKPILSDGVLKDGPISKDSKLFDKFGLMSLRGIAIPEIGTGAPSVSGGIINSMIPKNVFDKEQGR